MIVDVTLELDRLRIKYTPRDNALRVSCPFHDDSTPSCDVYLDDGGFTCHGCKAGGGIVKFIAKVTGKPQHVVQAELEARYGGDETPVEAEQVERYHRQIYSCKNLLEELAKRAINSDTIRKWRLGADGDRITIPITNPRGEWVNVRRYSPGATTGLKMTNMKGRGKRLRLYPFVQLRYDKIIVCGGEIKALAVAQALNQYGFGAVALSGGGEKDWVMSIEPFFEHKQVWVCNDIDAAGVQASAMRASRILTVADWVGIIELPLDIEEYPSGDVNDYLFLNSPEAFLEVVNSTKEFTRVNAAIVADEIEEPKEIKINDVATANYVNKRVRCSVSVSALDDNIYYVPRKVKVECSRDQEFCAMCPVFLSKGNEFTIHPESSSILAIMESKRNALREEILNALRIPSRCPVAEIEAMSNYKVVETRMQKSLDLTDHVSDKLTLPAVVVDDDVDLNESYEIVGKPVPHPKTQAATIIVSKAKPIADALNTFDPGDTSDLRVFQPTDWTLAAIEAKLSGIYDYYENNITRIYNRTTLHRFIDLVYHSVLSINVAGRDERGWLEALVIGDTAQGKSDTLIHLSKYLGLGVLIDCENATVAGLLGGLETVGDKRFVQWGVIPTHDRRLVVLEELRGMHQEVFAKLTDMRSTGRAQIQKIQKRETQARTRIVAVTNPWGDFTMDMYSYGVLAARDIIKNPEDIRRFDVVMILNKNDIEPAVLNSRRSPLPEPFSQETARRLVLWSWTRKQEQVIITDEVWSYCLEMATKMLDIYSDSLPILDRGSAKFKILKFAAATACRTFSCDDSGLRVIVRKCHVDYAVKLLNEEYSSPSNGYLELSMHDFKSKNQFNPDRMREEMKTVVDPKWLASNMLITTDIDQQDFQDWCGWTRDEAGLFLSNMVRCHALKRMGRVYRKTPKSLEILRQIAEGALNVDPPPHITNDKGIY